jgi:PhnB protein
MSRRARATARLLTAYEAMAGSLTEPVECRRAIGPLYSTETLSQEDPLTDTTQPSVSPELSVRRGREAVEFYKAAFGAVEIYRVGGREEGEAVVSQLSVGNGSFWVADESPPHKNFSPESLGGGTVRLLLVVDDPRAVVERAVALGATEIAPVDEQHGWLLGRIEDPFGHHWEIGNPLVDWPPISHANQGGA